MSLFLGFIALKSPTRAHRAVTLKKILVQIFIALYLLLAVRTALFAFNIPLQFIRILGLNCMQILCQFCMSLNFFLNCESKKEIGYTQHRVWMLNFAINIFYFFFIRSVLSQWWSMITTPFESCYIKESPHTCYNSPSLVKFILVGSPYLYYPAPLSATAVPSPLAPPSSRDTEGRSERSIEGHITWS